MPKMHLIFLGSDVLVYLLVLSLFLFLLHALRCAHWRLPLSHILRSPVGAATSLILGSFLFLAVIDSIHFQINTPNNESIARPVQSVLDLIIAPVGAHYEKTYSGPFTAYLHSQSMHQDAQGHYVRGYSRLKYAGTALQDPAKELIPAILQKSKTSLLLGFTISITLSVLLLLLGALWRRENFFHLCKAVFLGKTRYPVRTLLLTFKLLILISTWAIVLSHYYHILGTDKVGQDVFYLTVKSIRTGVLVGTLTTLVMLPFAIFLGCAAGFYGGIVDDVIQYVYTTLSSIPGVLLIAAAILSIQIFTSNHPAWFNGLAERADLRLLALCFILGVTSWTSLCRLLRAETLKIRELDYIQAARVLGVSEFKIILRHVIPNVMHIIIIAVVLDFSALVLAEAVLSYVGIGVDPSMISWGNMINGARLELAREPIIWWPLLASFIFMFVLVLVANLFSDVLRDSFDPRLRD